MRYASSDGFTFVYDAASSSQKKITSRYEMALERFIVLNCKFELRKPEILHNRYSTPRMAG